MRKIIGLLAVMAIMMPVTNMAMSKSPNSENVSLYTDTLDSKYPDSWYFIDTISANRVTVVIDSIRQSYGLTDFSDSVNVNILDTPNILALPNSYIILDLFYRDYGKNLRVTHKFMKEVYVSQGHIARSVNDRSHQTPLTKTISKVEYYIKPKYYVYLLMQGKEIVRNSLEPIILGKIPSMIDCNYEAYYRVLLPVWSAEDSRKRAKITN